MDGTCAYRYSAIMKTRDDLERERAESAGKKERSLIGVGGAVLIVAGGIAIWLFVTSTPDKTGPQLASNPIGDRDSVQCERLVQLFRRDGIVKGARIGGRITVDEQRWRQTSEENRRGLLSYVSCAAFNGRGPDQLDAGAAVTVHAASGRLLAKASRDGVVFSPAP